MTISLNMDQYHLQNKLNISTSRMRDYADMSIDDIIEAEAKEGNAVAKDYGRELFGNIDELIETFQLDNPSNKYNIIAQMSGEQKGQVLEMLEAEDMVVGLNFFTQDKLEELLSKVSSAETANVALEAFPLARIIEMMPEEQLEKFFMGSEIEKEVITNELRNLSPEILVQMAEGITGQPTDMANAGNIIGQLSSLPEKQFKEMMSTVDPEIQQAIIYQMANENKDVLANFENTAFIDMVGQLQKPDMVKSMIALNQDSLQVMTKQLPEDLFAIVATQVNTEQLAKFLIDRCPELLEKFASMANGSTTH